jgi:hypothetical protein
MHKTLLMIGAVLVTVPTAEAHERVNAASTKGLTERPKSCSNTLGTSSQRYRLVCRPRLPSGQNSSDCSTPLLPMVTSRTTEGYALESPVQGSGGRTAS